MSIIAQTAPKPTSPSTGDICQYCGQPAEPYIDPPLCPRHLDVVVLICYLQERDLPVNAEYARQMLDNAIENGGCWTITPDDLESLFASTLRRVQSVRRQAEAV